MTVKISDLRSPIAVWKLVEGDPTEFIAILRGEKPLDRQARDALADWLEGKLMPVAFPPGRPKRATLFVGGYDISKNVGLAALHYEFTRIRIRNHGFHKKSTGRHYWPVARLQEAVAKRYGVNFASLFKCIKDKKKGDRKKLTFGPFNNEDFRMEVAREVRRAKPRENR